MKKNSRQLLAYLLSFVKVEKLNVKLCKSVCNSMKLIWSLLVVQDSLQTELQSIMEEETKKENEVFFYIQFNKISCSFIVHTFCSTYR